jgi:hypothetical protein
VRATALRTPRPHRELLGIRLPSRDPRRHRLRLPRDRRQSLRRPRGRARRAEPRRRDAADHNTARDRLWDHREHNRVW